MKFWDIIEKIFSPIGWLLDKLDVITKYVVPLFALLGDAIVAYSTYFIIVTPELPWLWIFPMLLVTLPVLFFFNSAMIDVFKSWIKKK